MRDIPIPNWLSLGMVAAFVLAAACVETAESLFGNVLLAGGVLAVGTYVWRKGSLGGGVVKLLAASSLWIGPNSTFLSFMAVTWVGLALLSAVVSVWNWTRDRRAGTVPCFPVVLFALNLYLPDAPMWHAVVEGLRRHV